MSEFVAIALPNATELDHSSKSHTVVPMTFVPKDELDGEQFTLNVAIDHWERASGDVCAATSVRVTCRVSPASADTARSHGIGPIFGLSYELVMLATGVSQTVNLLSLTD